MRLSLRVLVATLALIAAAANLVAATADTRHFVLSIYDLPSGKREALLELFRSHFKPLGVKHGFEPIGYWTTTGSDKKEKFIHMVAGASRDAVEKSFRNALEDPEFQNAYQTYKSSHGEIAVNAEFWGLTRVEWSPAIEPQVKSPARAFELRVYNVSDGKMDAYLANYKEHRLKLFEKHGFSNLGFWTAPDKPDIFVMLLAHKSAAEIDAAKVKYHDDPNWKTNVDGWSANAGKTTTATVSYIMQPADFSPWK